MASWFEQFDTVCAERMRDLKVLCEDYDVVSETYYGRSYMDAPEIDGKIFFTAKKKIKPGTFVNVKIDSAEDYDLIGHAAE